MEEVNPRVRSLKFGCHLDSEENLVWSLPWSSREVFVLSDSKSEGWEIPSAGSGGRGVSQQVPPWSLEPVEEEK